MSDTLAALHAAIVGNPADRTVRLVYADALDESGKPSDAARAAFIRVQIALEGVADNDPQRPALAEQCRALFAANWIDWWGPVCAASFGLPEPYVPSPKLGARLKRLVGRDARAPGDPYKADPIACSVRSDECGFTAQFYAGFLEMLAIHNSTIDTLTGQIGLWFNKIPFCRLRFTDQPSEFEWKSLSGPHLAKVVELIVDRLSLDVATLMARSTLSGLTALKAPPGVVRALVHNPVWTGLRSLALGGITPPAALRELAESCTLRHLEELTFAVSEPPEPLPLAGLAAALGPAAAAIFAHVVHLHPLPATPIRGPDYWPAFMALARSQVVPRLRRLRIIDADPTRADRLPRRADDLRDPGLHFDPFLSDECVLAVADALDPDKLEKLELPRTRISVACREELIRRFGSRLVLA